MITGVIIGSIGSIAGIYWLYREEKSIGYAYSNIRISSKFNELLPMYFFEKLKTAQYREVLNALRETNHYRDLSNNLDDIEHVLNENFVNEIKSVLEFLPGDYKKIMKDIVYLRLEIENLKIAISNSRSDIKLSPKYKINYLLTKEQYKMIQELDSFDDFLNIISKSKYYPMFRNTEKLSIAELQIMLEKNYFHILSETLKKSDFKATKLKKYFIRWIDTKNLWIHKYCLENNINFSKFHIETGTLSKELLMKIGKKHYPEEKEKIKISTLRSWAAFNSL